MRRRFVICSRGRVGLPPVALMHQSDSDFSDPREIILTVQFGLQGLVSKRRDRPYRAGRSPDWIKVKNRSHPAVDRVNESF